MEELLKNEDTLMEELTTEDPVEDSTDLSIIDLPAEDCTDDVSSGLSTLAGAALLAGGVALGVLFEKKVVPVVKEKAKSVSERAKAKKAVRKAKKAAKAKVEVDDEVIECEVVDDEATK